MEGYERGTTTFLNGAAVTVMSEPFDLHGGRFQRVVRDHDQRELVVPTWEQHNATLKQRRGEREEMQAAFRRLKR